MIKLPQGEYVKDNRPIIFTYNDYKSYILDTIAYYKLNDKGFTLKSFAKKLDVSASYLSMIIKGKRELSNGLINSFAIALKLTASEHTFFETLVHFNNSKDDQSKAKYLERMKQFKKYREHNIADVSLHSYMSNWLNITIREMSALDDFCDDPKWIQTKIKHPVSLTEVKKSLDFLLGANLLIKNQENKYERPNFQISCVDQIHSNALVQFHRNFLQLAGDSTVHSKSHERQLLGHCVSLDQGRFSEAKEILKDAFEKIQNLQNHQNKSEQVYSIELALFPLTKGEESE